MKPTKKLQKQEIKFGGIDSYQNLRTGEVIPGATAVTVMQEKDFNFHKAWICNLLQGLEDLSSKKWKVVSYILDQMDSKNMIFATQEEIANKVGCSVTTVNETISILKNPSKGCSILQSVAPGVYRVNPDILFKGSHRNRMAIVFAYNEEEAKQYKHKTTEDGTPIINQNKVEDDADAYYTSHDAEEEDELTERQIDIDEVTTQEQVAQRVRHAAN